MPLFHLTEDQRYKLAYITPNKIIPYPYLAKDEQGIGKD
jgi:hypothetical protein